VRVNVIILNYNGEVLIPECLPSVIAAKKASRYQVRITVIDNESTDSSLEVLDGFAPDIDIVRSPNRVFCSYNEVVRAQEEEVAILLNNDMKVDSGFIDPMVKVFEENGDAFQVAPKCFDFSGKALEGGRSRGFIRFGWFGAMARYPGWEDDVDRSDITFQSGFGAVRRDRFLELEGYDSLYLPGRLEDSDLGLRAWRKGWKSYYQPLSVVYHKGGESFRKEFGVKGVSEIDSRNSLMFFWKNIRDLGFLAQHVLFLPLRLLLWVFRGEFSAIKGFFSAFRRIGDVRKARAHEGKIRYELTDRKVFDMFR